MSKYKFSVLKSVVEGFLDYRNKECTLQEKVKPKKDWYSMVEEYERNEDQLEDETLDKPLASATPWYCNKIIVIF